MLRAGDHEQAVQALNRVLELAPRLPEAHVNMGFALLDGQDYAGARRYFESAIDLRPGQANAYWGLAVVLEHQCDVRGAIGAMRTYVHLTDPRDRFRRKALSALWEWESHIQATPEDREGQGTCREPESAGQSRATLLSDRPMLQGAG
jgi:Tfp pilus assembly protein PilF